jgi:transporter family-2 protein
MIFIFMIILALLIGATLAIQIGVNARLRVELGDPTQAALVSFATGTLALCAYTFLMRLPWSLEGASKAPWWVWVGGILGAFNITATIILAPRLGAATLLGLVVTGQMIVSIILDHYGLLGFRAHALSPGRVCGALLLVAGVVLIRKY